MQDDKQVMEAENMSREAEQACLDVCRQHLQEFLQGKPDGTYEEWLRSLHPENDYEGRLLTGFSELDHRFFVKESDHLKMWNDSVDKEIKNKEGSSDGEVKRQKVEARYREGCEVTQYELSATTRVTACSRLVSSRRDAFRIEQNSSSPPSVSDDVQRRSARSCTPGPRTWSRTCPRV